MLAEMIISVIAGMQRCCCMKHMQLGSIFLIVRAIECFIYRSAFPYFTFLMLGGSD